MSLLGVMKKEKLETSHRKSGMIDNGTHYFNSFYPDLHLGCEVLLSENAMF